MEMLKGASRLDSVQGDQVVKAKSMQDVCTAFNVSPVRQPMQRVQEAFAKKPKVEVAEAQDGKPE